MKRSGKPHDYRSMDDLFVAPLLSEIRELDENLSVRIQQLSETDKAPRERFDLVKDDVQRVVSKACSLSGITNSVKSNHYDVATEIAGKWSSFAAYCGAQISLNDLAPDIREGGAALIKDSHKPKIVGVVVSTKMQKTVTVNVENISKEPRTGKYVKSSKRYLVHDEYGQCKIGDKIVALETRPLSGRKNHSFAAVVPK